MLFHCLPKVTSPDPQWDLRCWWKKGWNWKSLSHVWFFVTHGLQPASLVGGHYSSDWLDSWGYSLEDAGYRSVTRGNFWPENFKVVLGDMEIFHAILQVQVHNPQWKGPSRGLEFSYNSLALAIENSDMCRLQSVASSSSQMISQMPARGRWVSFWLCWKRDHNDSN